MARSLIALLIWVAVAGRANAEVYFVDNPVHERLGENFMLAETAISFHDGVLPRHQDNAAKNYIETRLSDEQRSQFLAFSRGKTYTDDTAAERFAEYLTLANLQTRLEPISMPTRRVRLEADVTDAHSPGALSPFSVTGFRFPTLGGHFVLIDLADGHVVARGTLQLIVSDSSNNEEARRRNNLTFNWSGSDTNFRIFAGQCDALAKALEQILENPQVSAQQFTFETPGAPIEP
jgi:hypothetical protein